MQILTHQQQARGRVPPFSMTERTIGRYQILDLLGQGGMAAVYRAYDPRFERDVAIKMLYQPTGETDGFSLSTAKFEQEARIIAGLEHYAIVPVYDFGEHDDRPFLVMRLMDGGSLKEKLALAGRLPLDEIAATVNRICAALDKAHNQNVIHRDIKPGNIFFDEEGLAYLGDFGIARLTDHTQTTSLIGSPRYMAPEQAKGHALSPQTDVYQMGVVLFHMLSGQVPFNAETTESILYQHVYQPVPPLRQFVPDLPLACETVVRRAMAKTPDNRFPTAGELARTFAVASGQPLPPRPVQPAAQPQKPAELPIDDDAPTATVAPAVTVTTRPPVQSAPISTPAPQKNRNLPSRGWIIGLSLLAVVLFACSGAMVLIANPEWVLGPAAPAGGIVIPTPPAGSEEPTGAPGEPSAGGSIAPTATLAEETAPSGEIVLTRSGAELAEAGGGSGRLAYAADRPEEAGETDTGFDIYITEPDGRESRLTSSAADEFRPVWSPDGRRIAYHALGDTWEIYLVDVDGGGRTNLSRNPADDSFPQWSPDGRRIAFHSNRVDTQFDIYVVELASGEVTRLTDSPDPELGATWSPDGRQIAFYRQLPEGGRQLFVMDADGRNQQQITSRPGDALFPVWSPDGERIAYHGNRDGLWQIYTVSPNGEEQTRVSNTTSGSFYPSWSPNGEWLIFHAIQTDGDRELYMIRPDGSGLSRLTDTGSEERMPSWQPPTDS